MRTIVRIKGLLLCTLLLIAQTATSQNAVAQNFEGRFTYSITSPMTGGERMEMVTSIKDKKMLTVMNLGPLGGEMRTYYQGDKMIMVMPAMKMAYETDLSTKATKQVSGKTPMPKATGKKATVNGYAAEEWVAVMEGKGTMTMWLSSDFDKSLIEAFKVMSSAHSSQNPEQAEFARIFSEKGMMLVQMAVSVDGDDKMTMDLVKIEKTSIPDSEFVVPSDISIQKMDPSMMMQQD